MVASERAARRCSLWHALFLLSFFSSAEAFVGVDYGTSGDNLPTPQQVVQLLQKQGIAQVRIYDTNPAVLQAFEGSNIQLVVGIINDMVLSIGESNISAAKWVTANIVPFATSVNITAIAVGSEVLTKNPALWAVLVPALAYIHAALVSYRLDKQIKVSSPCGMDLFTDTFPPSVASFNISYTAPVIQPMLDFLSQTESYFMVNVQPFEAYQNNFQVLTLDYALFRPNAGVVDSTSGFRYFNVFDALVDATFYAIAALNHSELPIMVTETGWPSHGDVNELGASPDNAQTYSNNLVKHILNNTGTPLKPGIVLNTYLLELFNEDKRTGPTSERNWGLFNADQTPAYAVDLVGNGVPDSGFNVTTNKTWCVAKQGVSDSSLQEAMDYACGQGIADCSAIQPGMACWIPNSVAAHTSYAMNSYYQKHLMSTATCDFSGTAAITMTDPSYGSCTYPASLPLAAKIPSLGIKLDPLDATRSLILALSVWVLQRLSC